MGCKVLYLSVALLLYLMICEHVRAQCTQPSFESRNAILSPPYLSTQSFPSGSTVTFECVTGYVRDPVNRRASKSVTCMGNEWTSLELNCIRKSCGSPQDFLNGKYEQTGILFGDKITAVCDTGYILAGRVKERWCRDQGWDGRDPVCEAVKCEAPPTIENGQLVDQLLQDYFYLHAVSYKCNKGFSLIGSSSLHCTEHGTFEPDPPKCLKLCLKPDIPHMQRIISKDTYELGSFIDYRCEEGYIIKGENHIVCSEEGWKPEPPQCIALPTTTTAATKVTPKTVPEDALRTTTTTTTTTTKVTSKILPKDENPNPPLSSTVVGLIVGAVVVSLAGIIGVVVYKKRSKHVYSEKVATRNEDREL